MPEVDSLGLWTAAHLLPTRSAVFLTLLPLTSYKVEAAGIEPASRNRFTPASTCVVDCLISPPRAPVDRIARRPARNFFNRERTRR